MSRIALLAAAALIRGAREPHRLAALYGRERDDIAAAGAALGLDVEEVDWRREDVDWNAYDAALCLAMWDYQDNHAAALERIRGMEQAGVKVFNPSAIVAWNIRKTYLRDLADRGVRTIPTLWPDAPAAADIRQAFETFDADQLVLKRQVGAGAHGQRRFTRAEPLDDGPLLDRPGMIQPLIPAIAEEGEYSFLFVDGELSHALVKRAAAGDYRIQETYGGTSEKVTPSAGDLSAAKAALGVLDETPLYARVDMVRGSDGGLLLMELELIEPFLYPLQGEDCGRMLAAALARRLGPSS